MALSTFHPNHHLLPANITASPTVLPLERLLLKRCKIDLDDQAKETGATPKLSIPKAALAHSGSGGNSSVRIQSDLEDVHLYVLSPWVISLIQARTNLTSIQKEIVPLLTMRQFHAKKGLQGTFGKHLWQGGGGGGEGRPGGSGSRARAASMGGGSAAVGIASRQEKHQQHKEVTLRKVLPSVWKQMTTQVCMGDRDFDAMYYGSDDDDDESVDEDEEYNSNEKGAGGLQRSTNSSAGFGGSVGIMGTSMRMATNSSMVNLNDSSNHTTEEEEGLLQPNPKDLTSYPPIPYHVSAIVVPRGSRMILRTFTVNHYSYACREFIAHATTPPNKMSLVAPQSTSLSSITPELHMALQLSLQTSFVLPKAGHSTEEFPSSSTTNKIEDTPVLMSKFHTLILSNTTTHIGEKVTMKSTTIGRYCSVGRRSRLNNVVAMDNVTIGENCVLQNSVLANGVTIGENCNLNDVQVGAGAIIIAGTKSKGETIVGGGNEDNEPLL
jgi:carbonic anhydrase/acetyltransferase-like protein (isoleucine patch superfamily)